MSPPPFDALAAIALLDGVIMCPYCERPAGLAYDGERDEIVISHPYAWCPHAADPHSGEAGQFAMAVQDRLAEFVSMTDYWLSPELVNRWLVTA